MENIKFITLSQMWFDNYTLGNSYGYNIELQSVIKHLNSFLGDNYITEIKQMDVIGMINTLSICNPNTNKPMSKQSLRVLLNTAYRIFDMAIDNDMLTKNPAKNLKAPKNAPKQKIRGISKEEQILILNTPHRCRIAALIMMLMGLRTSEMLALQWKNIDFKGKRAFICERAKKIAPNRYQAQAGSKTDCVRYVTIPDNLCNYLFEEMKKSKSKLVFPKMDGTINTPSSWRSVWKSYNNALSFHLTEQTQSKYSPKGYPKVVEIHPHQLRHTYATMLYVSGIDPLAASKLLGHKSIEMTLGVYTDLDSEFTTIDISNFNDYLSSDLCKL